MNKIIERLFPYDTPGDFDEMIDGYYADYLKKANIEAVSAAEYITEKFNADSYKTALNAMLSMDNIDADIKAVIKRYRYLYMQNMAQWFNGVTIEINERTNMFGITHSFLTSTDQCQYIGDGHFDNGEDNALTPGSTYRIIEMDNWFHNSNELGYYMTTDDYDGDDIDYGHFFGVDDFNEHFKVQ